jgi:polar amino acid transport system substrate-binding protein
MTRTRLLATLPPLLAILLSACSKTKPEIRTLDDAQHAKIGVMTGTTGEAIAKSRFPQADIKSFPDAMDAVAALKSDQLEGVVTSFPTAIQVSKRNPELAPLPDNLSNEDSSVAMRKGDELLAPVNKIIADLKRDGTLADMRKRWFKPDLSPYEAKNIPAPTAGTPLRIGVSATREPMNFVDKDGRVTGHDGELARRIAATLGRPIEFSNMKFMALIPALQSGKVDLIVTGMTATDERRKFVDFSDPYFENAQVMLVRKAGGATSTATPKLVTTADIADKRIGVMLGSAHDTYAVKTYPKAKILQYSTAADMALAIKTGKADVGLYDEESLMDILRDDPSLGILGESLFSFHVGVGFNKKSTALHDSFNKFLAGIKQNGVYKDMIDRWITKRETRMPDLGPAPTGGTIAAGISTGGAPFTFVKDNVLMGFDIELLKRFGATINKDIKFSDMEFGGLVAAVASGKSDLIAASIYITPERLKLIDFSDPYYESGNRVFALKTNIAAYSHDTGVAKKSFFDSIAHSFRANILEERRYLLILDGLKTTAVLSIASTIFGTLLGGLVCFLRMSHSRLLSGIAKIYISILRGTPVLVLLMIVFYVVFASVDMNPVLCAVIAFGMNFAAYVSEIFRTGIEGIDRGQSEAGIAMGFTRIQTFLYVVLPQTVRRILPVYKGEFISMVKMTSIVGYIAVQDLTKASDIIRSRTFDAFFPLIMVAALYFSISWLLMQSLEHLERVTDPKYKRAKATAA